MVVTYDFEYIWERICRHAGEEFRTVQGLPFTYAVFGSCLVVTRDGEQVNRSLSKTNFRKAAVEIPVDWPGEAEGTPRLVLHLGDPERQPHQRRFLVTTGASCQLQQQR